MPGESNFSLFCGSENLESHKLSDCKMFCDGCGFDCRRDSMPFNPMFSMTSKKSALQNQHCN
jgi:hypothetical protein